MKWHEICLSIPAAILEVLNAWENGVLSVEAVQVCPASLFFLPVGNKDFLWFPQYLIWFSGFNRSHPCISLTHDLTFSTEYFEITWVKKSCENAHHYWRLIGVANLSLLPYSFQLCFLMQSGRMPILVRIRPSLTLPSLHSANHILPLFWVLPLRT